MVVSFCIRIVMIVKRRRESMRKQMKKNVKNLTHGALIAAMYVVLTHMQNMLLPGSATWAIQMRMSEALGILAFFTPAAPRYTVMV